MSEIAGEVGMQFDTKANAGMGAVKEKESAPVKENDVADFEKRMAELGIP